MYCSQCQTIVEDTTKCPFCGNKKLRQPEPVDICFLTEIEPIPAGILKDVLDQNHIPVLSNSSIGAAMSMRAGSMFERIRFFVPYQNLADAKQIVGELFAPADEESKE